MALRTIPGNRGLISSMVLQKLLRSTIRMVRLDVSLTDRRATVQGPRCAWLGTRCVLSCTLWDIEYQAQIAIPGGGVA